MGKQKNALRGHFLEPYAGEDEAPDLAWLELAAQISTIGDDTQEATEEEAYYDSDGTPETTVVSVAGAYTPEGNYDATDPAQQLIADMKYKIGDGRKVWHKVVSSNGEKQWVGRATVTAIVAGAGDASAYETFSCNIRFDKTPVETAVLP